MSRVGRRRPGSFGRRLTMLGTVHGVGIVLAATGLLFLHARMEVEEEGATAAFVEEQWIGDEVATAVMRQLAAASAYLREPDDDVLAEFRSSGDEAARRIRQYLFHDLSPEQRLQLEAVKEAHQRLEVSAARSLELAARGRSREAAEAANQMADHGLALQAATSRFLLMRQETLAEIRSRSEASMRVVYVAGALFALLTLVASIVWARYLNHRLARPLSALAVAAERIGDGDLGTTVPIPSERDLAVVAIRFNRMAQGLVAARDALERRNKELQQTLERLRTTQAELVQTEKLSALGQMMAGLAHELNNPLASVLGFGELLEERVRDGGAIEAEEIRTAFVEPIVAEASRARELTRTLLSFARRSGDDAGIVRLQESMDVVARIRAYAFEQEGVRLDIAPVPDVCVAAEPQQLQQVLLNLVNNAFDAVRSTRTGTGTGGGGLVRVTVTRSGEETVDVTVEDDGPGFPEMDRVFEPFYTTKPVGQGTGLGLTLVHGFMEEWGGQVRVENRSGGGARVVLRFRVAEPLGATPAGSETSPATIEAPGDGDLGAEEPLRVLVVEDEAPLRDLQKRLLRRAGAVVELAAGGEEARRLLERIDVDLVVSDVRMPDGSGLDLYDWALANRPALADRFLFVSGDLHEPRLLALAAEHPERFLSKPFHADEYLRRIRAAGRVAI